jgi:AcrR family transcriptional regulator
MIQRLTQSAYAIIADLGISRLTLDSVSRHAGVSKGALQYHFPTKMKLEQHLLRESLAHFEKVVEEHRAGDTSPGAWTRAYLCATLDERYEGNGHAVSIFLAPVIRSPKLTRVLNESCDKWSAKIAHDGIDPMTAQIVRLAADGGWWSEIAGTAIFKTRKERRDFIAALIKLTRNSVDRLQSRLQV